MLIRRLHRLAIPVITALTAPFALADSIYLDEARVLASGNSFIVERVPLVLNDGSTVYRDIRVEIYARNGVVGRPQVVFQQVSGIDIGQAAAFMPGTYTDSDGTEYEVFGPSLQLPSGAYGLVGQSEISGWNEGTLMSAAQANDALVLTDWGNSWCTGTSYNARPQDIITLRRVLPTQ